MGGDMYTCRYQIIVSGRLGMTCREAFRDLRIDPHGADTVLTGDLNQSGLHDVFTRLRDLVSGDPRTCPVLAARRGPCRNLPPRALVDSYRPFTSRTLLTRVRQSRDS